MHLPHLQDILIILSFSVVIVFLLQRLKLPSILGFLITGIIIGPYGFSLINAVKEVEIIAEIGVILLLFVIGMELSIKQLASIKKTVFIGGFVQVSLSVIAAATIHLNFENTLTESIFIGFLFSLSSTAIVLKVFQDRDEIHSQHGKNALGILIFQDLIVVPMMLVTPILAGQSTNVGQSVVMLLAKSLIVVVITIISARYLVPKLMHAVAKTKSKELFLLTTIAICFSVAFLTSEAGLSLALGAFLAGLIISESEYSHQATSIILPFRELFTSFFFISVGMLLDLTFFFHHFSIIALLILGVFLLKTLISGIAIAVLNYPSRTIILTALSLFQLGEFGFILSKVGIEAGIITELTNQYFLSVSIATMLLTPFVIIFSEKITNTMLQTKIGTVIQKVNKLDKNPKYQNEVNTEGYKNHLVIIGYGINGSNLAKAAKYAGIKFLAVEFNAEIVARERKKDVPIIFGDASQDHILELVHIKQAQSVVIAISNIEATKAIITNIRFVCKSVYLVVRTRYVKEINELLALGADEVIPEEFETSVEIFSRVLHNFLIPADDIQHFVETIRADNYHLFQSNKQKPRILNPIKAPDFKITCVRMNNDSGGLVGKTITQANIRQEFGINIVAILRKDEMISNVLPEEKLLYNDLLYVQGDTVSIDAFYKATN